MRRFSIVLSVLVLAAMILAACGGEETSTSIPTENIPQTTVDVTATSEVSSGTATEIPTEVSGAGTATGTPGIPVTGQANSDRLSNELKYKVLDQSGKQIGKVDDMVLDLSKAKVLYVIVSAEKKIAVPWASLKLSTDSTSASTNGQKNAFVLQTDTDTFKNAPTFDVKNMPALGAEPDSWDISFRKYWSGGGAASGKNTPSPAGTAVTDTTATATSASNNTTTASATPTPSLSTGAGTSQGTGIGKGATSIQGVQLASKVLNAKVTVGAPGVLGTSTPGTGTALATSTATPGTNAVTSTPTAGTTLATSTPSAGTSAATSTPGTGTALATSTPSAGTGVATSTPGTGTNSKNVSATINDLIVNTDAGDIMYIVIKESFDDGVHIIPVPLSLFKLDSENEAFVLNVDVTMLQNAPFFPSDDQFPDMTMPGWNSEFDSFWQNNGLGGTGIGSQATPTP
jgi:sporulation protein YlmC with PRC-barrel domain